jgi:hypothetical protein
LDFNNHFQRRHIAQAFHCRSRFAANPSTMRDMQEFSYAEKELCRQRFALVEWLKRRGK